MPDIQCSLGNEYISFNAAGVVPVSLLQDKNAILHVEVHKVNLEVGPVGHPPLASRQWALEENELRWKGNPIGLSLPWGWGGVGWGGGGVEFTPDPPDQLHAVSEDELSDTPPPSPPCTPGTPPSATVYFGRRD